MCTPLSSFHFKRARVLGEGGGTIIATEMLYQIIIIIVIPVEADADIAKLLER